MLALVLVPSLAACGDDEEPAPIECTEVSGSVPSEDNSACVCPLPEMTIEDSACVCPGRQTLVVTGDGEEAASACGCGQDLVAVPFGELCDCASFGSKDCSECGERLTSEFATFAPSGAAYWCQGRIDRVPGTLTDVGARPLAVAGVERAPGEWMFGLLQQQGDALVYSAHVITAPADPTQAPTIEAVGEPISRVYADAQTLTPISSIVAGFDLVELNGALQPIVATRSGDLLWVDAAGGRFADMRVQPAAGELSRWANVLLDAAISWRGQDGAWMVFTGPEDDPDDLAPPTYVAGHGALVWNEADGQPALTFVTEPLEIEPVTGASNPYPVFGVRALEPVPGEAGRFIAAGFTARATQPQSAVTCTQTDPRHCLRFDQIDPTLYTLALEPGADAASASLVVSAGDDQGSDDSAASDEARRWDARRFPDQTRELESYGVQNVGFTVTGDTISAVGYPWFAGCVRGGVFVECDPATAPEGADERFDRLLPVATPTVLSTWSRDASGARLQSETDESPVLMMSVAPFDGALLGLDATRPVVAATFVEAQADGTATLLAGLIDLSGTPEVMIATPTAQLTAETDTFERPPAVFTLGPIVFAETERGMIALVVRDRASAP